MDSSAVVEWFSKELWQKKIKIQQFKDLKTGSLFMEAIHIYFPKYIDLSKVYIKPKNSFQVIQNYRQLLNTFTNLGWKKIEPQKYVKQQDKDCLDIANFIIKKLTMQKKKKQSKEQPFIQTTQSFDFGVSKTQIQQTQSLEQQVQSLQKKKQKLLDKIISIEHIINQATDTKSAKALIYKILQQ